MVQINIHYKKQIITLISLILLLFQSADHISGMGISYYYDSSGRLTSSVNSSGQIYNYLYDKNGNLIDKSMNKNLLLNSSFENVSKLDITKAEGWDYTNNSNLGLEISKDSATGEKAQKIWISDLESGQFAGVSQSIKVSGSKEYTANVQVQLRQINGASVQFYIDFLDAQNQYVGTEFAETATANWEYVNMSIKKKVPTTAVNARIYIILRSNSISGSGNLVVDTVNFEYGIHPDLLVNGSFEEINNASTNLIEGWTKVPTAYTGYELINDSATGSKAQKIWVSNLGEGHFSGIYQNVQVSGGKEFTANAQIQLREINGARVQFYIDFLDAKNQYVATEVAETASVNWEYVNMSIKKSIPATAVNARVYIILRSNSVSASGNLAVDTVNFEYGKHPDMLVNGDFEQVGKNTNIIEGWIKAPTPYTGYELINDSVTRSKAEKIWVTNLGNSHFSGIYQRIQVTSGKEYSASAQVQLREMNGIHVQFYIDFLDSQNKYVGTQIAEIATTNLGYVNMNIKQTVPATAVNARVYIIFRSNTLLGSGNLVVDNVEFTQI